MPSSDGIKCEQVVKSNLGKNTLLLEPDSTLNGFVSGQSRVYNVAREGTWGSEGCGVCFQLC